MEKKQEAEVFGSEEKDYQELTEEALVKLAREKDEIAQNMVFERYKKFVKAKSQLYYLLDGDKEDIIQEGMIGLFRAIRDYQEQEGSFRAFAQLCINRQIYTAITKAGRKKHEPLNSSVSIHGIPESDEEMGRATAQMVSTQGQPEEEMILKESMELLLAKLKEALSDFEYAVFQGIQEGKPYKQIAGELGKETKAVDNAVQRIRKKVRALK